MSEITLYDSTGNPQSLDGDTIQKDFLAIGVGQAWQDMTSQRQPNTEYVNDTEKPIMVSVWSEALSDTKALMLFIDNVNVGFVRNDSSEGGIRGTMSAIVPAGSTYEVMAVQGTAIGMWTELR